MNIDRIVFCLNASPLYSGMWDIVSKVYTQKTKYKPTLIFVGTKEELYNEVKHDYGEVYRVDPVPEYVVNPNLDWTVMWTCYWYMANKFPDDVCMLSGIDEIPCNNMVGEIAKQVPDDKYFFPLGPNPYGNNIVANGWSIAKGSVLKNVLGIEDDLRDELKRIWENKDDFCKRVPQNHHDVRSRGWWGMDEAYISSVVYGHPDTVFLSDADAKNLFFSRRITRNSMCSYDVEKMKQGAYWAVHMVRPITEESNKKIIDKILYDLDVH